MSRFLLAFAALAAVSASPVPRVPNARSMLDAAKAASGGKAWDRLEGSHESGEHSGAAYETWLDFRHYGMRSEARGRARGFNGRVAWQTGAQGGVAVLSAHAA